MAEVPEKYLQVPLTAEYWDRLDTRAKAADRVACREAARIIKDVLDGRYVMAVAPSEPSEVPAAIAATERGGQNLDANGAIIKTIGLGGAVQGSDEDGQRSDYQFFDDPQTKKIAPEQSAEGVAE